MMAVGTWPHRPCCARVFIVTGMTAISLDVAIVPTCILPRLTKCTTWPGCHVPALSVFCLCAYCSCSRRQARSAQTRARQRDLCSWGKETGAPEAAAVGEREAAEAGEEDAVRVEGVAVEPQQDLAFCREEWSVEGREGMDRQQIAREPSDKSQCRVG